MIPVLAAGTFIEGFLAFVASVVLFCGSIYVLLSAVFGARMGYLVAATGLFGFMVVLSALWAFGAPGTPAFLGPKGELPHWVVAGAGRDLRSPDVPIEQYPGGPWQAPEGDLQAEVEPATLAFQEHLAEEATHELERAGVKGEIEPAAFEVADLRFAEVDGTEVAAGRIFATEGGPEVLAVGYKDPGSEPLPSYIALVVSVIGFVVHLPFLDRAERRRKEILTGGDQPAWRGPA